MSIQAVSWVLDQYIPKPGEKLVLICLANHADRGTGLAWPSVRVLSDESSLSPRSVHTHLASLRRQKFIEAVGEHDQKTGRAIRYRILFNRGSADIADPKVVHRAPPTSRQVSENCRPGSATVCRQEPSVEPKINKPTFSPRCRSIVGLQERGATKRPSYAPSADVGAIHMAIASRIGPSPADGLNVLSELPASDLEQLVTRHRRGTLDASTIERLRNTARAPA